MGSRLPAGVTLRDISDETYMIALQGKRAVELMDRLSGGRVSPMPRFSMIRGELLGSVPGLSLGIGRTGYTGEDGVELFYDARRARELWEYPGPGGGGGDRGGAGGACRPGFPPL